MGKKCPSELSKVPHPKKKVPHPHYKGEMQMIEHFENYYFKGIQHGNTIPTLSLSKGKLLQKGVIFQNFACGGLSCWGHSQGLYHQEKVKPRLPYRAKTKVTQTRVEAPIRVLGGGDVPKSACVNHQSALQHSQKHFDFHHLGSRAEIELSQTHFEISAFVIPTPGSLRDLVI